MNTNEYMYINFTNETFINYLLQYMDLSFMIHIKDRKTNCSQL